MLITIPTLVAKNILLTSGILYVAILTLTLLLTNPALSNNHRPYLIIPTVLLLPGLPPSPTFISKLWATNMFSFGAIIPLLSMVVLINIYLIVTYATFFIYQTEMFRYGKRENTRIGSGLVVVWAITILLPLNPLTVVHH